MGSDTAPRNRAVIGEARSCLPPAHQHPSLAEAYRRLLAAYGPQGWWPGDGPWEVMVGAVLTQHTAWRNVERALFNLKADGPLTPERLRTLSCEELAERLRPAGTFRVKAARLQALLSWCARWDDDLDRMAHASPEALREELLAVPGIGPETADAILLYALGIPYFVVDAYARRIFGRLGLGPAGGTYAVYQAWLHHELPASAEEHGEYHALLVHHAKVACRTVPRCAGCCLLPLCPTGQQGAGGARPRSASARMEAARIGMEREEQPVP
ncbi:MAG: endonuclease [Chloroflexi bacterium]|nr:endonuclease [Chloroflexota bacterium]